eukprot:jgi/Chlat1/310/Chrsp1S03182
MEAAVASPAASAGQLVNALLHARLDQEQDQEQEEGHEEQKGHASSRRRPPSSAEAAAQLCPAALVLSSSPTRAGLSPESYTGLVAGLCDALVALLSAGLRGEQRRMMALLLGVGVSAVALDPARNRPGVCFKRCPNSGLPCARRWRLWKQLSQLLALLEINTGKVWLWVLVALARGEAGALLGGLLEQRSVLAAHYLPEALVHRDDLCSAVRALLYSLDTAGPLPILRLLEPPSTALPAEASMPHDAAGSSTSAAVEAAPQVNHTGQQLVDRKDTQVEEPDLERLASSSQASTTEPASSLKSAPVDEAIHENLLSNLHAAVRPVLLSEQARTTVEATAVQQLVQCLEAIIAHGIVDNPSRSWTDSARSLFNVTPVWDSGLEVLTSSAKSLFKSRPDLPRSEESHDLHRSSLPPELASRGELNGHADHKTESDSVGGPAQEVVNPLSRVAAQHLQSAAEQGGGKEGKGHLHAVSELLANRFPWPVRPSSAPASAAPDQTASSNPLQNLSKTLPLTSTNHQPLEPETDSRLSLFWGVCEAVSRCTDVLPGFGEVKAMSELKSDSARARCWIYSGLSHGSLREYIRAIVRCEEVLKLAYQETAILRSHEAADRLLWTLQSLDGLLLTAPVPADDEPSSSRTQAEEPPSALVEYSLRLSDMLRGSCKGQWQSANLPRTPPRSAGLSAPVSPVGPSAQEADTSGSRSTTPSRTRPRKSTRVISAIGDVQERPPDSHHRRMPSGSSSLFATPPLSPVQMATSPVLLVDAHQPLLPDTEAKPLTDVLVDAQQPSLPDVEVNPLTDVQVSTAQHDGCSVMVGKQGAFGSPVDTQTQEVWTRIADTAGAELPMQHASNFGNLQSGSHDSVTDEMTSTVRTATDDRAASPQQVDSGMGDEQAVPLVVAGMHAHNINDLSASGNVDVAMNAWQSWTLESNYEPHSNQQWDGSLEVSPAMSKSSMWGSDVSDAEGSGASTATDSLLGRSASRQSSLGPDEISRHLENVQLQESYVHADTLLDMEDVLLDMAVSGSGRQAARGPAGPVRWVDVVGAEVVTPQPGARLLMMGKEYTVYKIEVRDTQGHVWTVRRRYRDFHTLRKRLEDAHPGSALPLPWPQVESLRSLAQPKFSPEVVESRRALLQRCLRVLLLNPAWASSPPLVSFLAVPKRAQRAVLNQHPPDPAVFDAARGAGETTVSGSGAMFDGQGPAPGLGLKIRLLVYAPPQRPMDEQLTAQQGLCPGCGEHLVRDKGRGWLGLRKEGPRLCEYTAMYFCTRCHSNDTSVLPARVLQSWDFRPGRVSQLAKAYLESISSQPMLCVSAVNPALYSRVPLLAQLRELRQRASKMAPLLAACPHSARLLAPFGPRTYLLEQSEFYAMRDLVDLSQGAFSTLPMWFQSMLGRLAGHITAHCSACSALGAQCAAAACHDARSMLFSFQADTIQCSQCSRLFHLQCYVREGCRHCGVRKGRTSAQVSAQSGSDSGIELDSH